jgi:hypothetical protein
MKQFEPVVVAYFFPLFFAIAPIALTCVVSKTAISMQKKKTTKTMNPQTIFSRAQVYLISKIFFI